MSIKTNEWITGPDAWLQFINLHPELGYRPGRMNFHNFLRGHRARLIAADAIRLAKRRFWVAHGGRFPVAAFELATGRDPVTLGILREVQQ